MVERDHQDQSGLVERIGERDVYFLEADGSFEQGCSGSGQEYLGEREGGLGRSSFQTVGSGFTADQEDAAKGGDALGFSRMRVEQVERVSYILAMELLLGQESAKWLVSGWRTNVDLIYTWRLNSPMLMAQALIKSDGHGRVKRVAQVYPQGSCGGNS